uniref:BPL/LPL catalytic domain-containing protein n=1 Tax=Rhodnius prolixus TaxID=13249 RepID=T1HRW8_RHOPR
MALLFTQASMTKCIKITSVVCQKNSALSTASSRKFSSTKIMHTINNKEITKSVFISQSHDIFTNLALEDWLYKNVDFTNHHIMLFWRNDPCVVIGRHQNPWLEANLELLDKSGIELARRNSGGGTVYHDRGNLNITFFAPKDRYNRKKNLELISKTLEKEWNLNPEINKKEDIVLDNDHKISGTASKLGRPNSYHHCTILVNVDREKLFIYHRHIYFITTNATKSVPAKIVNLSNLINNITVDNLAKAVGWAYLRTSAVTHKDEGWSFVEKQRGFQMINPTDDWFPGLNKILEGFKSWDWKFAKTPNFTIYKNVGFPELKDGTMRIGILVEKSVVAQVLLDIPEGVSWSGFTGTVPIVTSLVGQKFTPALFVQVEDAI